MTLFFSYSKTPFSSKIVYLLYIQTNDTRQTDQFSQCTINKFNYLCKFNNFRQSFLDVCGFPEKLTESVFKLFHYLFHPAFEHAVRHAVNRRQGFKLSGRLRISRQKALFLFVEAGQGATHIEFFLRKQAASSRSDQAGVGCHLESAFVKLIQRKIAGDGKNPA